MIVRNDVIEKIMYEYYGVDPVEILAEFQQEDSTYTEKDVDDYLTLDFEEDQLEWADLEQGTICSLRIFKKGEKYWGCFWFDTNGNDTIDAYIKLEPLILETKSYYVKESTIHPSAFESVAIV